MSGFSHWLTHHKFDWLGFAWVTLYWAALWLVPSKRLGRGWFTRYVLRRFIPPRRFWESRSAYTYRYMLLLAIWLPFDWTVWSSPHDSGFAIASFWGVNILLLLDDYFNGDDDPKERWEKLKNAVKWKWLPSHDSHPIKGIS